MPGAVGLITHVVFITHVLPIRGGLLTEKHPNEPRCPGSRGPFRRGPPRAMAAVGASREGRAAALPLSHQSTRFPSCGPRFYDGETMCGSGCFYRRKKKRRVPGADTFPRARDPPAKDHEPVEGDLWHRLAAAEKEMKVKKKRIKINDSLMTRRELSRENSRVYAPGREGFIGGLHGFQTFLLAMQGAEFYSPQGGRQSTRFAGLVLPFPKVCSRGHQLQQLLLSRVWVVVVGSSKVRESWSPQP